MTKARKPKTSQPPENVLEAFREHEIQSFFTSAETAATRAIDAGNAVDNARFILDALPVAREHLAEQRTARAAAIAFRIGMNYAVLPVKHLVEHAQAVRASAPRASAARSEQSKAHRAWAIGRFAELFALDPNRTKIGNKMLDEFKVKFPKAKPVTARRILEWVACPQGKATK